MIYRTLEGEDLEISEPSAELAAFIARVQAMLDGPSATENDMIALVYGRENPLLDQTVFGAVGAVTKAVFENPAYHVLCDMIGRKRVQLGTLDLEKARARYTMTVKEAAGRLGITEGAVRQAIAAHRLAAWKTDGVYFVSPDDVANFKVGNRGPARKPKTGEPLAIVCGSVAGARLRVKGAPLEMGAKEGRLQHATARDWTRLSVLVGREEKDRLFVIEPSSKTERISFCDFYVEGKFAIVEKINNAARAREMFKAA